MITCNKQRLLDTFLSLVRLSSEYGQEKNVQDYIAAELKKLGAKVYIDYAGRTYPTNAQGNVIGRLQGTLKSKPFVLVTHMDTVSPGKNIKPVVKKDCVVSDGTTILGGDDKAGIAIVLELMRTLREQKLPHPPIEAIFTLNEEAGMAGSKNLEYHKIKGREGLVLDGEELGEMQVQGPAVNTIEVWVRGLAAHAGVCPEKGISALEVAADALSRMKLGRIDAQTVANFAIIQGGKATNIVTDEIYLKGEARSLQEHKLEKQNAHIRACFEKSVQKFTKKIDGKIYKPSFKMTLFKRYSAVNVSKKHPVVQAVVRAAKKQGFTICLTASGGGCDANVLAGQGFILPNLGVGVRHCHTVHEKLNLKEFYAAFWIVLDTILSYKK